MSLKCPDCGRSEFAVLYSLYRPEPAPWWWRLLSGERIVKRVVGYCVTCPHTRCGAVLCVGDGGPHDVWRPHPRALSPRYAAEALERQNGEPPERKERPQRDPTGGLDIRTVPG